MAKQLTEKIFISGGYLDSNASISSISELKDKLAFLGQSVHMPIAFENINGVPYPIDFWSIPTVDGDVKWEIKTLPSINTIEDFALFKKFITDYKTTLGYFPMSEGFSLKVDGEEYIFGLDENNEPIWKSTQNVFDDTIADAITVAVEDAVNAVTSGASEAFDTLQEVEAWINENSGKTVDLTGYVREEDLEEYATKDYVDSKVGEIVIPSLDGYATETWVSEQGFLTEHQDISGLATKEEVSEAIASIEIPSVDGLATETWVSTEIAKAQNYTDEVALNIMSGFNWITVEGDTESHKVRHWRGSRANYEILLKNNALNDWTRYVVIDNYNGNEVYTEYFGSNQISELTGQLLPVNDIIGNITEGEALPYNRYLVGSNGVGYSIYECVMDLNNVLRWIIKPFDYRFGVRVISKGLKNYIYNNGQLMTYDDVDCGIF